MLPDDATCEELLAHVQRSPLWEPSWPHRVHGLTYWQHTQLTMTRFGEVVPLEVHIPVSSYGPDRFREVYRREAVATINSAEEG